MLGEMDLGFDYRLTSRWNAFAGYRILGASNVALPTNQIYSDLRGIQDVESIDSNGSLIMHGGYAGLFKSKPCSTTKKVQPLKPLPAFVTRTCTA